MITLYYNLISVFLTFKENNILYYFFVNINRKNNREYYIVMGENKEFNEF